MFCAVICALFYQLTRCFTIGILPVHAFRMTPPASSMRVWSYRDNVALGFRRKVRPWGRTNSASIGAEWELGSDHMVNGSESHLAS